MKFLWPNKKTHVILSITFHNIDFRHKMLPMSWILRIFKFIHKVSRIFNLCGLVGKYKIFYSTKRQSICEGERKDEKVKVY